MRVIKRDGSYEEVKIEKILYAVDKACRGIENVESIEIAKKTISGLHENSTTEELDKLSIHNAVMLMAEEPAYSKVAARMLADMIRKEVGRDTSFREYIQNAYDLNLLSKEVYDLASQDFDRLEYSIAHQRDDLFEYFGLQTVYDRYLLRHPKQRTVIERPQWLYMRVALGLSQNTDEALEFYELMSTFKYSPATPTLFNSGTQRPQLSSCYLLTVEDDSLDGIYSSITDCAKLSKFSGGIGIDWTKVRSSGSLINGTNGLSNGIIPFLKVFDSSVHAVNQGGKRKGAAAIYLENWHADIEDFLMLRNNTGAEERRTHNLNLALWISDLFMQRVENNEAWSLFCPSVAPELNELYGEAFNEKYKAYEAQELYKKQVPARELYANMIKTLAETGNGWMCFKDKANLRSAQTGKNGNIIHSSNLCTEILEVTDSDHTAVCNLGSINLASFVVSETQFDFEGLKQTAQIAVKYLDRVVDINFYPTSKAKNSNQQWRPIGLGIMGLQDVLFKMNIPFESNEAKVLSDKISECVYYHAVEKSVELAQDHGSFEEFDNSKYSKAMLQPMLASEYQQHMPTLNYDWQALAEKVKTKGIRNSLMIAIAPTATIASIQGVYESIEPQTANIFKRETLSGEFLQVNKYLIEALKTEKLWSHSLRDKIVMNDGSIQNIEEIPQKIKDVYKTSWEISQKQLIDMAVSRSAFICQSQSLNLFMEAPDLNKLSSMYMYAWKSGVKTTYYLRSRAKTSINKTTQHNSNTQDTVDGRLSQEALACSLENPESCESCQ